MGVSAVTNTVADNLAHLLRSRAESSPTKIAYTFLVDGERETRSLTYAELDARAATVAARLTERLTAGDRALLLYPPGLDFVEAFFGSLYAGVVAVPVFPPDPAAPHRVLPRINAVAADCAPSVILTVAAIAAQSAQAVRYAPALAGLDVLATDEFETSEPGRLSTPGADDLAFLQYTSGSTGNPKGVVVSHGNLLANERMLDDCMRQGADSVLVSWLPAFHDMGLIGVINYTAFLGASCVLMSPQHFLQRPVRWLDALSRHRGTYAGSPNFGFELCLRRITPAERAGLDLASVEVLFNGAEPVRPDTIDRFADVFAGTGLRRSALQPCYGLAEATLVVTSSRRGDAPRSGRFDAAQLEAGRVVPSEQGRALASCGPVAGEQQVLIVDPRSRTPVPPGRTGEIWVSGPHVGLGYWQRPDATAEVFGAIPSTEGGAPGGFLRTGDVGFLADGELYVVGRLKDLVIVRGRNLAPQDLERSAEEAHPGLRRGCGAVFQTEGDEPELVVVQEFDPASGADPRAAIRAIREAVLRDAEVEFDAVVLIAPRTVPKTSSGKIQRRGARRAYLAGELDVVARWSAEDTDTDLAARIEAYLRGVVGGDATATLAALGVDSLRAAQIRALLEAQFGVAVSLADFLAAEPLETLAARLAAAMADQPSTVDAISPGESGTEFALSDNQLALWYLHEREPGSHAYNVAVAFRVTETLDHDAFRGAWEGLVTRHPALRTRFGDRNGTPYQEGVPAERGLDYAHADATGSEAELRELVSAEAAKPFDLTGDPLLRVRVYSRAPADHWVLVVVHHIVTDFWSLALMIDELGTAYGVLSAGRELRLAEPASSYADFVHWQARRLAGPGAAAELAQRAERFAVEPPPLDLPTDRPRPAVQTERGGSRSHVLPALLAEGLRELAAATGTNLYTVALAAFGTLLWRYTGQDDIVLGSPTAGRDRPEFADVLGYFVNPVPLRLDLAGDPSFGELLARCRVEAVDALDHQRVPLVRLVERVQPRRDAGRSPLFQTMVVHQKNPSDDPARAALALFALGSGGHRVTLDGLTIESLPLDLRASQFDLTLVIAEAAEEVGLSLQFNADLFDEATAQRMLGHLETVLTAVVANPELTLSRLPLLTAAEQAELTAWNDTARDYSGVAPIPAEFAARAAEHPDAVALEFGGETLTYGELDLRSTRLAARLAALGVGRGSVVGVVAERSIGLVVALLGTQKAGAAYLPLDPEHPRERVAAVLADAAPAVVIGDVSDFAGPVLDPDDLSEDEGTAVTPVAVGDDDPAYVIFTSGSTGRPKGVVNTHGGIRNRLAWMQEAYGLTADDAVLQKTPATFDVSVWEFFWPLTTGAKLVLARPGGHRDAGHLAELIETARITTVHFVPSMLQLFLAEPELGRRCASLRRIICSGEALPPELARRCLELIDAELYNLYGPTEAAVDVTAWRCEPGQTRVPIGHAIANTRIHLLDPHGNPVPVGVPGELHIGGVQVAAGYLGRPDLTRERFVPDPFAQGGRLYRTGDLARRAPDGSVEFLGRLDHQVKIHGNRIELGEIEATLLEHPAVGEAVVVAAGTGADARLVGYVVPRDSVQPDEVRTFLGTRLPQYMVPAQLVVLEEMPLNSSGKLDRAALPGAGPPLATRSSVSVAPRTPEERALARVVGQVLGLDDVGVLDNFFELGGDSIRALQVRVLARQAGLDFSLPEILRLQTVAGLAAVARPVAVDDAPPARAPFDGLTEQERAVLPDDVVDAYPLSRLQEGLVFHSEASPDYETYVMGFHLGGRFDEAALREALDLLVARHPMLRTSFDLEAGRQLVHATATVPVTVHQVGQDADGEIRRFMREQKWRKFDWSVAPLLRVDVHERSADAFQCTFSHPQFDGWSMALLSTELMTTYGALANGEEAPERPPLRLTYADFVALEREAVESPEEREFWATHLAGASRGELPRWPSRRSVAPSRHRRTEILIDDDVRDGLLELARTSGTSLKSVVLAAHLKVVCALSGRTDVTTGIIANGRPEELDGDRVIAVFLNTIPLRMTFGGGTWRDLVRQVLAAERGLLPHRRFPMAELVRTVGKGQQLFDTAFNYIHFHVYEALMGVPGLDLIDWYSPSDQTYFPLTAYFHLDVASGRLLLYLDVDDAVLDPEQVELIGQYYQATAAAMAADPDARYETAQLLPAEVHRRELSDWNATGSPWPSSWPQGVHRRVAGHAARTAEEIAVRSAGECLTYRELDRCANRLAHRLDALGVQAGDTVGVALHRSVNLPVALLAVLKVGAAYVPMDPGYPRPRLEHMLIDSGAQLVITESDLAAALPESQAAHLLLDRADLEAVPDTAPAWEFDENALAYVIYTSGSTGVPKGVEIQHRALDNLLHAMADRLGWHGGESLLAVTTLSFDIAGLELFLPLTTGGRLDLATERESGDPYRLRELLGGVSTMQATPATWRMLVDSGWAGHRSLQVLCGGEALTAELAEALRSRCGELWNVYGPTETTIWSCATRLDEVDGVPPIGTPLANTTCHVLDAHGQVVLTGTAGELYIGGLGLARGYRNRPDLTQRGFVPDPFSGEPGARLYRTGDLARRRPDGQLEFLGRSDSQLKVRGFRIELGEIESVLGRVPGVRQAVVVARPDTSGDAQLVAYVVPRDGAGLDAADLRGVVAGALPAYMVPALVVLLDGLPLTPNGKVDRKALPAPGATGGARSIPAPPGTELEQRIAKVWCHHLGVEEVGIDDRFFDIGGHSLLMVRIHAWLRAEVREIPLTAMFEHATIRRLAAYVGAAGDAPADTTREHGERRRGAAGRRRALRAAVRSSRPGQEQIDD
jgi:amino acid adenylation domain-containing protein